MSIFKVGDIVMLKSGGPKMTITEGFGKGMVYKTCWFVDGVLKWGEFVGDTLTMYEAQAVVKC